MSENQTIASNTIFNQRLIAANVNEVFEAFRDANKLAKWWGPKGFSNTFEQFEFAENGTWKFVMHDENGTNYPNESVFREIIENLKIVIEHIVQPLFTLTISLESQDDACMISWEQIFESETFANKMRDFLQNANEQNLDRLQDLVKTN